MAESKSTVKLALLSERDLPALMVLARAMHAESPHYYSYDFNVAKVQAFMLECMTNVGTHLALGVQDEDGVFGFLFAWLNTTFFGMDAIAEEKAFFISAEKRGKMAGTLLVRAYADWAKAAGARCAYIGATTGVQDERTATLLRRNGYSDFGLLMIREFGE